MAEYNEKSKVNKEGVIAPDGYHYMPDGTLMADSEYEIQRPAPLSSKRKDFFNKARLGGGGCEDVVLFITGVMAHKLWYYDHVNKTKTRIYGPDNKLGKVLAMWGNKFYSIRPCGATPWYNAVNEFEVDFSTNTYTRIREIEISYPGFVSNACGGAYSATMRDANTIITHWQEPGNQNADIHVFDISGPVAVPIYAYDLGWWPQGDIVYYPDTDRALLTVRGPVPSTANKGLMLIDLPTGNIVDFLYGNNIQIDYRGSAMYKYQDRTYVVGLPVGTGLLNGITEVIITGNTISLGNQWDPTEFSRDTSTMPLDYWRDADSGCAFMGSLPSYCYNIGDVGPEGGIIFALPNTGSNQTNYYYEIALDDVSIGGTPIAGFNSVCGGTLPPHLDQHITLLNYGPYSVPGVWPTQSQVYITGAGAYQPIVDLFNNFPPVRVEWFASTPGAAGGPLFGNPSYGWTSHLPSGTTLTNILQNNSGVLNVFELSNPFINLANYPPPQGPNPTSFTGFARFTGTPPSPSPTPSGWSLTGAEWGVVEEPIATGLNFGDGWKNTLNLHNYPLSPGTPTGGIHPWLDTHNIAATLCTQYGVTNDWYLPSFFEFDEAIQTVPSLIGLSSPGQNSEHIYWTSSGINGNQDKYAWAYNTDPTAFLNPQTISYRCHALSVRPIRRFECEPEPCPVPPNCNFEYNYRDGTAKLDGGFVSGGGNIDGTADTAQIHWNTTNEGCSPGTPPINLTTDSVIGGEMLNFAHLNRRDVLGNVHSDADFNNHNGYIVSVWDTKYNFIGKWKYSTISLFHSNITHSNLINSSYDRPGIDNHVTIRLTDVQHLEGDYPVIYYAGLPDVPNSGGSHTGIFIKLEWNGNTGNYETGCNSTIFGNLHPYYSPTNGEDYPWYCGPLYDAQGTYAGYDASIPRYATFPPLDLASNPLTVYPDFYSANPTAQSFGWGVICGGSGITGCMDPQASNYNPLATINSGCNYINHCWSICAVKDDGTWFSVSDPWFAGQPYGPIAMENNPNGTTNPPFSSNPYVNQDFIDFYIWVDAALAIGPLTIGQSFTFQISGYSMQFNYILPNGQVVNSQNINAICFKYEGVKSWLVPLGIINNNYPIPTIDGDPSVSCCIYSGNSSSLVRPYDNDSNSIKIKVGDTVEWGELTGASSKRIDFLSKSGKLNDYITRHDIKPLPIASIKPPLLVEDIIPEITPIPTPIITTPTPTPTPTTPTSSIMPTPPEEPEDTGY